MSLRLPCTVNLRSSRQDGDCAGINNVEWDAVEARPHTGSPFPPRRLCLAS